GAVRRLPARLHPQPADRLLRPADRAPDQAVGPVRPGRGEKGMSRSLRAGVLACAVCAVVLSLLPFTLSGYNQVLASKVALYFIAILGLTIVTGYAGQY